MSSIAQIRSFLEPGSVAVVGAGPVTGDREFSVVDNLTRIGYRGEVYPVNPKYGDVLGLRCYPAVTDIPGAVDLAVILTARERVPGIIQQCADKGIGAAVVVSGGFADADDEEGKRLQDEIVQAAREGGVRILGPNTIGSANAFMDFSTSHFRQIDMRRLPVGVVCQSGLFFGSQGRMRLLGKGLDVGNSCDVDVADGLAYFGQDPDVKVVALHIEGVGDGSRFVEVAHRVVREKPVLVLKTGRTERGAAAALSHTGSLVGRDEVWDAVCKQCGLIRVGDVNELGDLATAFCHLPLMRGRRVGLITGMGSVGVMGVDACERYGLEVARLSPAVKRKLDNISPSWSSAGNPLDMWPVMMTSGRPLGEAFRMMMAEVLGDPGVDGVFLFAGAWFEVLSPPVTEVVRELAEAFPDKPIAWCPYEGWLNDIRAGDVAAKLAEAGKGAVFTAPEDAIRALSRLAEYREFLERDT